MSESIDKAFAMWLNGKVRPDLPTLRGQVMTVSDRNIAKMAFEAGFLAGRLVGTAKDVGDAVAAQISADRERRADEDVAREQHQRSKDGNYG